MPDSSAVADPETQSPRISLGLWAAAAALAGVLGWLGFTYPPKQWYLSNELSEVNMYSPAALQEEKAATEAEYYWKNTYMRFAMLGLGIAASTFVLAMPHFKQNALKAAIALICGLAAGVLAAIVGIALRTYFNRDLPIPFISDEIRPLVCDSVVYAAIGTILVVPISIYLALQSNTIDRAKAASIPLAGLLSGLLVPLIVSITMSTTAITNAIPPTGAAMTAIWIGVLAGLVFIMAALAGPKKKAGKDTVAENP